MSNTPKNTQHAAPLVIRFLFYILEEIYYKPKKSKYVTYVKRNYQNGYIEHDISVKNKTKGFYGTILIREFTPEYHKKGTN